MVGHPLSLLHVHVLVLEGCLLHVVLHGVHLFHGIRHDLVLYHAHLLQSHPSLVQVQSRLFVQAQSHLDAQVQVQSRTMPCLRL